MRAGVALRCALRHRCDFGGRRLRARQDLQSEAWSQGYRLGSQFLDEIAPLSGARWADAHFFHVRNGKLAVRLLDGSMTGLANEKQFAGYLGEVPHMEQFLLRKNGLLIGVKIDAKSEIGKDDPADVSDVWIESALTVIRTAKIPSRRSMRKTRCKSTATGLA
jgi:hypothetical protein